MYEFNKWAELDLNQRRQMPKGLQPFPFNHSGIDPFFVRILVFCFLKPCKSFAQIKRQFN